MPPKPKLTDTERRERFEEMARKVDASEKSADFDEAIRRGTSKTP